MKKLISAAMAVMVLASAGAASAQSYGAQSYGGHDRDGARDGGRDRGQASQSYNRGNERWDGRRDSRAERRYKASRYSAPRGYQARSWRRGERLPSAYRARGYAVDYRQYGLRAPPRGYQYVRVNNDVVLTAVATGLIVSVLFEMFQ